jgi:MarR family transcriptional regulator, organic hydroperoxide resistance regulator
MNDSSQLDDEAVDREFRRMIRRFVVERDKVIFLERLSLPQLEVLNKLQREGPLKAGQLSEDLHFSPGAMTALCDKLVAAGMVARHRPEQDRRTVLLEITEHGLHLLNILEPIRGISVDLLLKGFTAKEKQQLQQLSLRIHENLEGYSAAMINQLATVLEGFEHISHANKTN